MVASLRLTFDGDRRLGTNCGERERPSFYPYSRHLQRQPYGRFNPFYNYPSYEKPDDIRLDQDKEIVEQEIQPVVIDEASYNISNIAEEKVREDIKKETGGNLKQELYKYPLAPK